MRATLWKLHQWLGLLTCFAVLMWGVSGALHPIMSHLQPAPAKFSAPAQSFDLSLAKPIKQILTEQNIEHFSQIGLVNLAGQHYYRVEFNLGTTQGAQSIPRYFSFSDGSEKRDADQLYAEQLAQYFTGQSAAKQSSVSRVTAFSDIYPLINRILPVWRIEYLSDPHLTAYIDTEQARLVTLSDPLRDVFLQLFRLAHDWSFLDSLPWLQLLIMLAFLFAVIFSAISGVYFYILLRPTAIKRLTGKPLQRTHRILGTIFSVAAIMSAGSGIYHLLHGFKKDPSNEIVTFEIQQRLRQFSTAEITDTSWASLVKQPLARLAVARLDDKQVWLISNAGSAEAHAQVAMLQQEKLADIKIAKENIEQAEHHAHSDEPRNSEKDPTQVVLPSGNIAENGSVLMARSLAASYAQRDVKDIVNTSFITHFGSEYGFIFKRLPVYRVEFSDAENTRVFIENTTSSLAAEINKADTYEGLSFAWLHKWRFNFLSKDVQDAVLVAVALGNLLVAILGLSLFIRKKKILP